MLAADRLQWWRSSHIRAETNLGQFLDATVSCFKNQKYSLKEKNLKYRFTKTQLNYSKNNTFSVSIGDAAGLRSVC